MSTITELAGRRGRVAATTAVALALALSGCGGGNDESATGEEDRAAASERALAGVALDPAPDVSAVALPDAATGADAVPMRAEPGGLLLVFFGYTNCPDICPTTMADVRAARAALPPADADRVSLAMVTVDPARDTAEVLTQYTQAFDPAAHALRTEDDAALRAAATAFGADYQVATTPEGDVEVGHTSGLYVVDDRGRLRLQWTFGTPAEDIGSDLAILLDTAADEAAAATAGGEAPAPAGATTAAEAGGGPAVTGAWARATVAGQSTGAAYLVVEGGEEDDTLVSAAVAPEVAAGAMVHATTTEGDDTDLATMRVVADGVAVPAGEEVAFAPGGHHVMLVDLARPLEVGDRVAIDLEFARAGTRTVTAEVRER